MKRLLVILLILVQHINVWGQGSSSAQLPSSCDAYLPNAILKANVLRESDINKFLTDKAYGQKEKPDAKKYWIVYSDRVDNQTYRDSKGQYPYTVNGKPVELEWNEKLRIARIEGDYALVYSEPNAKVQWPKISKDAVSRGWVKMDNLLLWGSCLADDRSILYKALICRNVDKSSSSGKYTKKRYLHPTREHNSLPVESDLQFCFVMKREGGKVLLATQNSMNGISDQVLYGWFNQDSFIPWNQRSYIEPTWDEETVEYLASKGAEAVIYDVSGYRASGYKFAAKDGYEEYKYRVAPAMLRFPILDGTTETTYECSSFGAQDIEREARKKEYYENKLNINLMIVIDGTRSMGKFFMPVYEAIKAGCEFFDDQKYKVKVGVVIYRDYSDGKGLVEVFPFHEPNHPELLQFLQDGGSYGIKSVGDKTNTEALFYGMNEAITKLKIDPAQSNVMLVVGDCGNASKDSKAPTQAEIEKLLIEKDIQLLSFQVQNLDLDAWNKFNAQMTSINRNILQAKYDNTLAGTQVRHKRSGNGYEYYNSARRTDVFNGIELFFGLNKYAASGTTISTDVLTELIRTSLKDYAIIVQHHIDMAISGPSIPVSQEVKESIGFKMNQEYLKKKGLGTSNELLAFRGTTAKYYRGDPEYAYYKPILFITDGEFTDLLRRLEPVYAASKNANSRDRKAYINAIKGLLRSFVPGLSDADMENMGMSNVTKMIQGLNEASAAMKGEYTIIDIGDPNVVKPAEFNTLVSDFAGKYEALKDLKGTYKFVKEFNNETYYWIPIEYLP